MWSARGPLWLGAMTLAVLLGGFGLWAASARLSGAIVAPARIEVAGQRQIVQHPDGGVVEAIRVTEGASVAAGEVLVTLDGEALRSELAIVEAQLFEMQARRGRLEAERDEARDIAFAADLVRAATGRPEVAALMEGQRSLFRARQDTVARQLDQMARRADQTRAQIGGIDAQARALARQLHLIAGELRDQRSLLDRGLAQAARVLSLEREAARLDGDVGELAAQRAGAEGRITELAIETLRLAATRREEAITQLRDFGYREMELAERRRALTGRLVRLEIRAPVAGIVLGLSVTTPRAVLRPAEPLLYLIPQDRPLVIAAQIPAIHVDQVHAGQAVRLVFSGLPSRTTPEVAGRVDVVSADVLSDQRTGQSFYRAEIAADAGALAPLALRPGMPVEAFIRTGERTALSWLVAPLADYFARAMRES